MSDRIDAPLMAYRTPISQVGALMLVLIGQGLCSRPASAGDTHLVTASSFADPADLAAYRQAIARGKTRAQALRVGDDGIGKWGDQTVTERVAMCALPPEDWQARWGSGRRARGKRLIVTFQEKQIVCELRDTMPSKRNITNGAGIDLNPGAGKAFGRRPPFMLRNVSWQWAE